jgi:transcriptional regulator with XRE-family HTH domain
MATKTIYDERYRKIIAKLVQTRKANKITQIELALKLKRPQSYIAKYEKTERRLDIIELLDICTALKIKISDLF